MTVTKVAGALICGISGKGCERRTIGQAFEAKTSTRGLHLRFPGANHRVGLRFDNVVRNCGLVSGDHALDYDFKPMVEEMVVLNTERAINGSTEGYIALTGTSTSLLDPPNVQTELIMLSLPAIAGQAIEPLAQLMETAYIGRLGPLELASAGVSISIFNIVSKVFNIPLLSIATSFVAEDISKNAGKESTTDERKPLSSVSTALLLAAGIGICEALALYLGSGLFLNIMGISAASPMRIAAQHFLRLRALGAPAVVLSLAIQGIFRGFKDTKTPVLCLGLGNFAAVLFFPILMYYFRLGVTGAAISTIASQYIVTILMIWHLNKRTVLLLPNIKDLDFGGYIRSGGFLLGRTLAAVMTITLSTSMAARQGPIAMAAHQICLQVWLSVSLLADAQASSGQALIASYFAKGDYKTVREITFFALKTGLFTGIFLAVALGVSFSSLATLFTNDKEVLDIIRSVLLFVSASQPVNALAYIFDGLHYGVSDFSYAASSMMIVGAMSSAFLLYAPSVIGLSGVWFGLTLFMGLRTVAGYLRLLSKDGPWWFLQEAIQEPQVAI
ncbi:protein DETOXIFICATION 45, chloroplastic isoform X1 [Rhododendron vialii]|uniref:protein DETOXIFICATION 45, chloroplastic isoform X1 n=1 Tax=Rhododendron vialii TaxID=182163 RepID=UPI00265EB71B|nr:protein DETOXIFICATION 45, chloroplastic isoform X1 [Rhododendron vialii]XP_058180607.1 protein DETOXIFICATION 45, chloroplastic isoform X1 [Rhododendron vialii]XP_058180608.1 protein DETOXIFICATION 45, chloroplastic isoform X1 [Rhododendron vialii]XP_058180609.1 protein DETOXIFICATION 45, chloroplastic isoform X1 [Rhododendron vialii]XP_058180610.1 protein DETOXIFICATION 45, chloroplastic isoform X1 [Rhododendron vialii]